MGNLSTLRCQPCEGEVPPLTRAEFEQYLEQVPGWAVVDDRYLEREFVFGNFQQALNFVFVVGCLAESEQHHPDIFLHHWKFVRLTLSTHAIGGLSVNDFVLAVKIQHIASFIFQV